MLVEPGQVARTLHNLPVKPCTRCGAAREPGVGIGVRLCDTCRAEPKGSPCSRCGGPKPSGRGRRLCDTCERSPRHAPLPDRPCLACGDPVAHVRGKVLCDDCAELRRHARARRRAAKRRLKACRGGCGRVPGFCPNGKRSPYCAACRAIRFAPKRRTCLHCDAKVVGPHDRTCPAHKPRRVRDRRKPRPLPKTMPARPLGRRVFDVVTRRADAEGVKVDVIYRRAGTHARTVYAWRSGERATVQFEVADRVVTALGLSWREVWNEGQLRAAFGDTLLP